ncbi:phage tail protein [Aeromonas caviae]|uniref:phage tail-collar fiber domain-containing protein n=1 Tax=Aeromonas caviae TaxID=648 RepID=UPI00191CA74F|nr:phage tail protein [Aeromonas caviae]MBL0555146.1 phage tail protein [Aeromonas caviae]
MSQVITNAFEQYWQSSLAAEQPVVLDEFILADIPNLDINAPIDPDTVLPPESQIVHRQSVDQRGRINNNAVAYTIVMDTTVGDFSFNTMYLRNKQNGVIGMIVYKGREAKLKTDQTTGQTGNSLVKSMLMGYDQAAEATLTNVDAGTWQIDYAARLRGMDEDIRQLQADLYGHHTFVGDGFKVVETDGAFQVTPGVAIVGGLRVELKQPEVIHPGTTPIGVWVDVHRAGSLLSEHQNHVTIITSVADLADHVDSYGYQHYVAKLATVQADGTIEDGRDSGANGRVTKHVYSLWKRVLLDVGLDLIGVFGSEITIQKKNECVINRDATGVFSWGGDLPHYVRGDDVGDGWVDVTNRCLLNDIVSYDGVIFENPEWKGVGCHSDESPVSGMDVQARALAGRDNYLRKEAVSISVTPDDALFENEEADSDKVQKAMDGFSTTTLTRHYDIYEGVSVKNRKELRGKGELSALRWNGGDGDIFGFKSVLSIKSDDPASQAVFNARVRDVTIDLRRASYVKAVDMQYASSQSSVEGVRVSNLGPGAVGFYLSKEWYAGLTRCSVRSDDRNGVAVKLDTSVGQVNAIPLDVQVNGADVGFDIDARSNYVYGLDIPRTAHAENCNIGLKMHSGQGVRQATISAYFENNDIDVEWGSPQVRSSDLTQNVVWLSACFNPVNSKVILYEGRHYFIGCDRIAQLEVHGDASVEIMGGVVGKIINTTGDSSRVKYRPTPSTVLANSIYGKYSLLVQI